MATLGLRYLRDVVERKLDYLHYREGENEAKLENCHRRRPLDLVIICDRSPDDDQQEDRLEDKHRYCEPKHRLLPL